MPISDFLSGTDIRRAFTVNALATGLVALVAVYAQRIFDSWLNPEDENRSAWYEVLSVVGTLIVTFVSALLVYWFLYWIGDFGGGMLAAPKKKKK